MSRRSRLHLGAIADDLTGATDLASALSLNGMSVLLSVGPPDTLPDQPDALIVALKIRSAPSTEAVAAAADAADFLQRCDARQVYFKYSSTFDSGDTGNIGPVSDMLFERASAELAVVCPAFPRLNRTVYQGHLFVGEHLLDRAALGEHPLTPRREASVLSLMARQTSHPVGLVPLQVVRRGAIAIVDAFSELQSRGIRYAVTDATEDSDLVNLAAACASHKLLTGSAGLAGAVAALNRPVSARLQFHGWKPSAEQPTVILSGSCSEMTRTQIDAFARHAPVLRLDAERLSDATVRDAVAWATPLLARSAVLICSIKSANDQPASIPGAPEAMEAVLGGIARRLYAEGFRRFVVAGGETSGAVVEALGVRMLEVGPELSPGVSWMAGPAETGLILALKSGNFGDRELFVRAANSAQSPAPTS